MASLLTVQLHVPRSTFHDQEVLPSRSSPNPSYSIWRGPTYVKLLTSYVVDPALCVFASLLVPGDRVRLSGNMPRYNTPLARRELRVLFFSGN